MILVGEFVCDGIVKDVCVDDDDIGFMVFFVVSVEVCFGDFGGGSSYLGVVVGVCRRVCRVEVCERVDDEVVDCC